MCVCVYVCVCVYAWARAIMHMHMQTQTLSLIDEQVLRPASHQYRTGFEMSMIYKNHICDLLSQTVLKSAWG